jgi:hypothetical protein
MPKGVTVRLRALLLLSILNQALVLSLSSFIFWAATVPVSVPETSTEQRGKSWNTSRNKGGTVIG